MVFDCVCSKCLQVGATSSHLSAQACWAGTTMTQQGVTRKAPRCGFSNALLGRCTQPRPLSASYCTSHACSCGTWTPYNEDSCASCSTSFLCSAKDCTSAHANGNVYYCASHLCPGCCTGKEADAPACAWCLERARQDKTGKVVLRSQANNCLLPLRITSLLASNVNMNASLEGSDLGMVPIEVLLHVCAFLPSEHLASLTQTCKGLYIIASLNDVWKDEARALWGADTCLRPEGFYRAKARSEERRRRALRRTLTRHLSLFTAGIPNAFNVCASCQHIGFVGFYKRQRHPVYHCYNCGNRNVRDMSFDMFSPEPEEGGRFTPGSFFPAATQQGVFCAEDPFGGVIHLPECQFQRTSLFNAKCKHCGLSKSEHAS